MEDFIKELQFLPKINFVSLNATDGVTSSLPQESEQGTEEE